MSSLLTNASALTALQALNMTQQNLATTQNQISTGLKVANASDNAAYWSIAQSLESNTGVLGAVNDSIAQSQSILGAATSALNNVIRRSEASRPRFPRRKIRARISPRSTPAWRRSASSWNRRSRAPRIAVSICSMAARRL